MFVLWSNFERKTYVLHTPMTDLPRIAMLPAISLICSVFEYFCNKVES